MAKQNTGKYTIALGYTQQLASRYTQELADHIQVASSSDVCRSVHLKRTELCGFSELFYSTRWYSQQDRFCSYISPGSGFEKKQMVRW